MTITYPELAREVIVELAPQELELLPTVTAAWQAGDGYSTGRGHHRGSIGIGLDPNLITIVIYPVTAGAITAVLGEAGTQGKRFLSRLRRRPKPPIEIPPLRTDQLEAVHAACLSRASASGLPPKKARMLADSVVGVLARKLAAPDA